VADARERSSPSEPPAHGHGQVAFLVNPASDNGRTRRLWPEIAHRAAEAGLAGEAYLSERPGQLAELAQRATQDGARLLVAVGGDGTVNEVVTGLMRLGRGAAELPELAVLPRGTGRDFARTFRIPAKLDGAIEVARAGRPRAIDVGKVAFRGWDGAPRSGYFANVAGAGMSGAVARRANSSSKALGGKASFLVATLAVFARWKVSHVELTVDGTRREGLMYEVVVANCRFLAGGMKMTPEAEPDDGLFDVLVIGDITRTDLALNLPKVYRGRHLPHRKLELLRGRVVSVDGATPLPVQLDGEQPGTTPARFALLPAALRVRAPA
jgi:YegS/Rv2252/BmrU family lipid kinase